MYGVVTIQAERAAEVCVLSQYATLGLDTNHRRGKKKGKASRPKRDVHVVLYGMDIFILEI